VKRDAYSWANSVICSLPNLEGLLPTATGRGIFSQSPPLNQSLGRMPVVRPVKVPETMIVPVRPSCNKPSRGVISFRDIKTRRTRHEGKSWPNVDRRRVAKRRYDGKAKMDTSLGLDRCEHYSTENCCDDQKRFLHRLFVVNPLGLIHLGGILI
jgi:hypothetical protein